MELMEDEDDAVILEDTYNRHTRSYHMTVSLAVESDNLTDAVKVAIRHICDHREELFVEQISMERLQEILQDWSVSMPSTSIFELEWRSPAGEDVIVRLSSESLSDMTKEVAALYDEFDPDDHAAHIYHAKHYGTEDQKRYYASAPDGLDDLIKDAHEIDNKYYELEQAVTAEFMNGKKEKGNV